MQSRDIVVVHTSDVHVDHVHTAHIHGGDGAAGLACVLNTARDLSADVVVLAGDTFDCHRLPDTLVDHAAAVIAAAEIPVVLLPGNHDPIVPDAVFHRPSSPRRRTCTSSALPTRRRSCSRSSILKSGDARIATTTT